MSAPLPSWNVALHLVPTRPNSKRCTSSLHGHTQSAAATLSPSPTPPTPPQRFHSHFKAQYLDGLKGQLVVREPTLPRFTTDTVLVVRCHPLLGSQHG